MLEITIEANNASITVAVEPINANGTPTVLSDVCSLQAVVDFFDAEPSEIQATLSSYNGAPVTDGSRNVFLSTAAADGIVLGFDLDGEELVDEAAPAQTGSAPVRGTAGFVTVLTNGGLGSTNIQISNGVTTVHDAIFNDAVRNRSQMTDAQLSNCDVTVNDEPVSAATLTSRPLWNGAVVKLDCRVAHTKG